MTKLNPRDRAAPAWVQAHWAKGGTNGRPALDDDARLAEAEALDAAYAEAEAFDAARAARCEALRCGWVGSLDDLGPLPDDEPEDDCRVLLGSCPMCYRAVYAPEPDAETPEDWERIAGDRR